MASAVEFLRDLESSNGPRPCACGCGVIVGKGKRGYQLTYLHGHHSRRPVADRLWEKVVFEGPTFVEALGPCWEWTAALNHAGYGIIGIDRASRLTHRVAYELLVGPIPEGLTLDHLCRNRACVRPSHLEPVTHQINVLRGEGLAAQMARRTACALGHELDGMRKQGRYCKTCKNAAERERRAAARAA